MMVRKDFAQLNFPKEKTVSCHANHSQMAKLTRSESGAYPDVKRAIKDALLHVAEDQANVGLSRLQLQSGAKAVVEGHWRHNEDNIHGCRQERPPFSAEKPSLADAQSRGSSIPLLFLFVLIISDQGFREYLQNLDGLVKLLLLD